MGFSRKRKFKKTSPEEEKSEKGKDEVTPKRRGSRRKEDPAEGCSHQVKETTPSDKKLSTKPSFMMGLQRRWSRLAGRLRNTKDLIVKKGRKFFLLSSQSNAQQEESKKKLIPSETSETSREAGESCAQERSRKRRRTEPQRSRGSSVSPKNKTEGHAALKKKSKKERNNPKGKKRSSGVTMEEQAGPSKRFKTAAQENSPTATVPLTLDKFTFHHVLGEGGYGKVMLATDSMMKHRVAVKNVQKRLLTEYKTGLVEGRVLQITHGSRFLVHGYGALHTENYVYYIMELVSGGTLSNLIIENVWLDYPTIKFIAAELVCGIQFLHTKGIIHRDLKPNNVLLTREGHIKITDFGLCLDDVYEVTTTTDYNGTPGYGAPEMILQKPYGASVDWFALGVITYIMVVGGSPFRGHTYEDIKKQVLEHEPTYDSFLDLETVDLLRRLLCKNQSCRLGVHGDIRKHPFFSSIHWDDMDAGKIPSPIQMGKDSTDTQATMQIPVPCSEEGKDPIYDDLQEIFEDLPFVCSSWAAHYHPAPMH
ncbi:protein kinase C theta type-like [Bufo gargarizans]|uniref:protein kinase C theta type-like n=1 Tax=Bufo gargarizans TaxID=30331 RepID=UPI001CF0E21E|nr:protein kinase C theta type-like [Bufo gargarizans]